MRTDTQTIVRLDAYLMRYTLSLGLVAGTDGKGKPIHVARHSAMRRFRTRPTAALYLLGLIHTFERGSSSPRWIKALKKALLATAGKTGRDAFDQGRDDAFAGTAVVVMASAA